MEISQFLWKKLIRELGVTFPSVMGAHWGFLLVKPICKDRPKPWKKPCNSLANYLQIEWGYKNIKKKFCKCEILIRSLT